MDYQILVLDLDGTLTNSKKEITPATKDALIDIQKKGVKVVLASGRPTPGVLPVAKHLHLDEFGGYVLSFNGGRITDCHANETMYNCLLTDGFAKPLYEIVRKYPELDLVTYSDDTILSGIRSNSYTEFESFINHMPIVELPDFLHQIPEHPNKFLVTGEPDIVALAKEEISAHFGSKLNVYCSDPFFLEIMPPGIDKGSSLLRLLESIGMSADQMICCGDGFNDITMIEVAGLGVAMANAQSVVLDKADFVTKSNDEDGVLHVINTFLR